MSKMARTAGLCSRPFRRRLGRPLLAVFTFRGDPSTSSEQRLSERKRVSSDRDGGSFRSVSDSSQIRISKSYSRQITFDQLPLNGRTGS